MGGTTIQVEKRLEHFEDCQGAIDQLYQDALKTQGPSAFDKFLDFANLFQKLSVYNAMLVMIQRPGALSVATRREWAMIGRFVRSDSIPIMILHPFGPIRFVYELSDTDGKPIRGEQQSFLFADGDIPLKVYHQTRQAAEKYGIEVIETNQYGSLLAGTAAGFDRMPETIPQNVKFNFRIKLNANHDTTTKFATLSHELAHIYCGHLGADLKGRWPSRHKLSGDQKEFEAESVAWLVCQRNGVTSRSKDYLRNIAHRINLSNISMYIVYEAANRVESRTPPDKKRT